MAVPTIFKNIIRTVVIWANGGIVTNANPLPVSVVDADIVLNATIAEEIEIANEEGNPIPARGGFIKASDGVYFDPGDQNISIVLNIDDTVNYMQVTVDAVVYRQTFGYTDGIVTSISKWTAQ